MSVVEVIQIVLSILIPVTLWIVNKSYEESKSERAEILALLKETRTEQDKIKERIYRLEIEFNVNAEAPTHMRRPSTSGDD